MSQLWEKEPDLAKLREAHALMATAPKQALIELKALASRGSLMSMLYIASAYKEGKGTEVNISQAEEWYKRAGDGGVSLASYKLGRLYLEEKDYSRAKEVFMLGASQDYMPSLNMLGIMYRDGEGVEKNIDKAKDFFERASALGHVFSKRNLGALLLSGHFGTFKILRGLYLFIGALRDLVVVGRADSLSDRLR